MKTIWDENPARRSRNDKTLETTVSLVTCGMSCFLHSSCDRPGLGFLTFSVAGIV